MNSKHADSSNQSGKSLNPIDTKVAGVTFEGRQRVVDNLIIGETLELVREPDNPHDPNAIKVMRQSGEQIGYIEKELAKDIAWYFEASMFPHTAEVWKIIGSSGKGYSRGVIIRIYPPTFDEVLSTDNIKYPAPSIKFLERLESLVDTIEATESDQQGNSESQDYVTDEVHCFEANSELVALACSFSGKYVVSGGWYGRAYQWDIPEKKKVRECQNTSLVSIRSVAFFDDDAQFILGGEGFVDGRIRPGGLLTIFDTETGHRDERLLMHNSTLCCVALSSDGEYLLSGNEYQPIGLQMIKPEILLYDLFMDRPQARFISHDYAVSSVAFIPNSDLFVSAGHDHKIKVWSIKEQKEIREITGHSKIVSKVVSGLSGGYIASGSKDGTIRVWDVNSGEEMQRLEGDNGEINSIAISSTGNLLASAGSDQTVRVWDINNSKQLRCFKGHKSIVFDVAFLPDDDLIVSCSLDKTVRLWSLSKI